MKTWFITGASRGFGARIAQLALERGDNVVATARNVVPIKENLGDRPNLLAAALDVANEQQARDAARQAVERFGSIDVLLNNAGFGLIGAVEEATAEEIERLYRTNVFGLLTVTRAVLPQMRAQRSGRVLNISSIGGYRAGAGFGVYCSTKFAVEGLSEALHAELAPLGIHVTVIEPGYFRTDFLDSSSLSVSGNRIADYDSTAGAVREHASAMNHNQPGDPEKFARQLVAFADVADPPVRVPFGSDTVAAIEAKHASDAETIRKWRQVSLSTDY
ncbi:SDR family NAD(P)-dependent oxidoreductase [Sinorhizobium medicae]|uniref:Short-chain dehydrogenase/reductase SDR n=1 Tax=Sinorhizobium medicae (strain WSM419) TaxID=366394 RepID=A6U8T1_SINMW|nr:oxidoreductase [Sinorhizobium medicae]ABR60061.1 short-chain dehydrogenase/reductase SDR [Sinorhizobium medicae WSM419]MDX0480547.1 SDR family NAD(P)-dependent oxidoreductase [Sinorhizobium medicae]MDX0838020.1 SDR family NAD(P)-dependent oxidoreductase [Sinorhizobium medicae]MDX0851362.1 SDR family NAD(P)-dependent oxidoreductase [Sinorhizobium medicae]MDX0898641.1 SDR family NAD(P)-dependent oxidoreductase [Sinorhizobium medicae]